MPVPFNPLNLSGYYNRLAEMLALNPQSVRNEELSWAREHAKSHSVCGIARQKTAVVGLTGVTTRRLNHITVWRTGCDNRETLIYGGLCDQNRFAHTGTMLASQGVLSWQTGAMSVQF